MSPQPKTVPTDAPTDAPTTDAPTTTDAPAVSDAEQRVLDLAAGKVEPGESAAERQIARAGALERERSALQDRIGKNRDYLRLMDSNEELSQEQGDWLDAFYPEKEKGNQRGKDEIERTRKVKEAARAGA